MKRKFTHLTLLVVLFLAFNLGAIAQIQVGTGTSTGQGLPIEPYYGYSYSQVIYLASEINASGTITELQWYFDGSSLSNSNDWTIYIGHTTKTEFTSTSDWIPVSSMTQVYSATFADPGAAGWITFDITDWAYNGTDNIVVAVDENASSYNGSSDDFLSTSVTNNRGILYRADNTNPDPTSPPTASYLRSYIANIIFGGITQSCPAPTAQTVSSITTNGADLGWTDGSGSHWDIFVVAAGGSAPTQTTIPTANDVDASQNPYTWSGGSAATAYEWYVRSDCDQDNTGTSSWVGPSSFTTACATVSTLSEDFSSSSTPSCWDNSGAESWKFSTGADYGASSAGDHTTGGGTNYAWIDGSSGVGTNALITPFIDLSGFTTPAFEFYYFSNNTNNPGDDNTLTVSFYDGAAWNTLLTYAGDDASWLQGLYDLSGYTITGDVQFRFVVTGTASTTYYNDILIDDVSVKEMPSCPPPSGLTASDMTATTARLAWNPATGATGYDWEVVPLGNAQGTGVIASGNVSDTTVVASGLTGGTTYDAYVQSDCGSGYTGPLHFTTACPAKITTFPYSTDFENAGSIPNCWTNDPTDAGGEWEFVTDNSHGPGADHTSGSGYYALLDDYWTSSGDSPFNLLTPIFDLSTPDKWYKVSYWAWIGPDGATNPIYFEISLDGGTTWTTLYTHDHSTTDEWFKVEMDLGFKKSDNVQFRFRGESIYGYGTNNSGIDDFTLEETQAPPVPLSDWAVFVGIFFILIFMVVAYRRRLA